MPRKKMWVEWEDGSVLSQSHKRPGDYSPLTRDGENKLGHVTLSNVDEDDDVSPSDWAMDSSTYGYEDSSDARAEEPSVLAEIATLVLLHLIDEARPHVKRWWRDQALPAIKSTNESARNRFAKARKGRRRRRYDMAPTAADDATNAPSVEMEAVTPAEDGIWMSSDEAHQRLMAALVARAFSDKQVQMLLNARIEDDDGHLAPEGSLEMIVPEAIEGQVAWMLEANPKMLDDLLDLFSSNRLSGAPWLPTGSEGFDEVQRLAGGKQGQGRPDPE